MFSMQITPVNPNQAITLPRPWDELERQGFHEDLLMRARGFFLAAKHHGFEEAAAEFLTRVGNGFMRPFNRTKFEPKANDPDGPLKRSVLDGLSGLADEFSGRIPSIVWDTFAYLGTRPNPLAYETILAQKEHLPFPWWLADTVLHATGKVYGLKHHMDSRIFAACSMIFEHNCDCGCKLYSPETGGVIKAHLPPENQRLATAALFSHLCSESLLIMALKMPFEMGVSPEAAELMNGAM